MFNISNKSIIILFGDDIMEKITYSKSLKAKLTLERGFMMESYQTLMDVVNTRKDVLLVQSFYKDRVANGKNKVAIIKGFKKNLVVYFALDPNKINEKYGITDVSETKAYVNYPTKLIIDSAKDLKNAIRLMEKALAKAGLNEIVEAEDIDYSLVYPEKSFDELVEIGLIKKRIRYIDENTDDYYHVEEYKAKPVVEVKAKPVVEVKPNPVVEVKEAPMIEMVNVKLKVMIKGKMTDRLFLFTNYTNWSEDKVLELTKVEDYFIINAKFPKNFNLEFKISLSQNWNGVEKGMFGEEIKNHQYYLDKDLEIEDIIYNWRDK
jgi:hypothetical protein